MALEAALPVGEFLFAVILILGAILVFWFLKNFLVNTVLGVVVLLLLNSLATYVNYPVLKIPITLVTVIVSAILGLAGVGLLILLRLLGIYIQ